MENNKKIVIIWEEINRPETWKEYFKLYGFEVELFEYLDAFDFLSKPDLIIYHVDVIHNLDEKHRSGWRIGLELFKEHEEKLNCPILFISITDTEDDYQEDGFQEKLKEIDEDFDDYIANTHHQYIDGFSIIPKKVLEVVREMIRKEEELVE